MMLCVFDVTWCAFVMMWCVFEFCKMLLSTCVHLFIMVFTFVSIWCAIVIVYCTFVLMFCYFIILHSENNWRIKIMFGILVIWTRLILLPSVRQTLVLPLFLEHDRNGLHMRNDLLSIQDLNTPLEHLSYYLTAKVVFLTETLPWNYFITINRDNLV